MFVHCSFTSACGRTGGRTPGYLRRFHENHETMKKPERRLPRNLSPTRPPCLWLPMLTILRMNIERGFNAVRARALQRRRAAAVRRDHRPRAGGVRFLDPQLLDPQLLDRPRRRVPDADGRPAWTRWSRGLEDNVDIEDNVDPVVSAAGSLFFGTVPAGAAAGPMELS